MITRISFYIRMRNESLLEILSSFPFIHTDIRYIRNSLRMENVLQIKSIEIIIE